MLEGRIAGRDRCQGLSPLGRAQAERLRDRLAAGHDPPVDVVVASPIARARQTAEIVDQALGRRVQLVDDLEEHRPGQADGLRLAEVEARFGPLPDDHAVYEPFAPGAESVAAFHYRVGRGLHRIVAEHSGRTVLAATHGGVIHAAFRNLLGLPTWHSFQLWSSNGSISEFAADHHPGRVPARWRLVRFNDAAHTAGLDDAAPAPGAQAGKLDRP